MITRETLDLRNILDYANVVKLPKEWHEDSSKKIWVDAILKIRKSDCTTTYAYAYNNYGDDPKIVRVEGTASMIAEILGIYPINYLTKDFMPKFETRDEIIDYVTKAYNNDKKDIDALTDDEIKTLAYSYAIGRQIAYMKQR